MTHLPSLSPMLQIDFIVNQSSVILQNKVDHQPKESNTAIGSSKSLINEGNKLGFFRTHDSLELKKMNSTRILSSKTVDSTQDHKRRCFEKLVVRRDGMTEPNVEDVKCALEAEVVDDTALIEATSEVNGFKNRYWSETDVGYGSYTGKKKMNKGIKKQGERCSMKCVNEKKLNSQGGDDKITIEKKISDGKGLKVCRKMYPKGKCGYQRKDIKNLELVATGVEEQQKVKDGNELEKIFGEGMQETDVNSKVSTEETDENLKVSTEETDENLKVSTEETDENLKVLTVETDENLKVSTEETDVILKVLTEIEKELITKLVETETVNENEKDDGLKLNPIIAAHTKSNEAEDQNVHEKTTVGSKKVAYSREEIEALRSVDEEGQKSKWVKVYTGFAPFVAREYTGLVVDAINHQTQRYNRVVNCGSTRHGNAILSMPPVVPLCPPSNYI